MRIGWAAATVFGVASVAWSGAQAGTAASRAPMASKLAPAPVMVPIAEERLAPLRDVGEKLKAGDFKGAYAQSKAYVARADFAGLPEETRHFAWYALGVAALNDDKFEDALQALQTASGLAGADGYDWLLRMYAAYALHGMDEAVYALTILARDHPAQLGEAHDDVIDALRREALQLPRGEQRQMTLMHALLAADWKPRSPAGDWSRPWADYAGRLLERGRVDLAEKAAARVNEPAVLAALRADDRFAPIVRKTPTRFDPAQARAVALAKARAGVVAAPRSAAAANALIQALIAAEAHGEAETLARETLARPREAFDDPDQLGATLDFQAQALWGLERRDEAVAVRRRAAGADSGDYNVGRALPLAEMLVALDRPREALALMNAPGGEKLSPFGRLYRAKVEACAQAALGDRPALDKALAILAEGRVEHPMPYVSGQLCADRLNAAAYGLIEALKDPETRLDALLLILAPASSAPRSPFEGVMAARDRALRAREDVRAATAAVAGTP